MYIIFVAGPSGAGKTKFTEMLAERLKNLNITCAFISMDDYYKEMPEGVNIHDYKENMNFDDPDRLNLDSLKEDIINLRKIGYIQKPVFDFESEKIKSHEVVRAGDVLIVEGTGSLLFCKRFQSSFPDAHKVFIDAESETLLNRKISRDIARGYSEDKIRKKHDDIIWPAYRHLIEPTKNDADFVILNNTEGDYSNLSDLADVLAAHYRGENKI